MRREFQLLAEDEDFLNSLGLSWEAIIYQGIHWILIHNYSVPEGFRPKNVSVAIELSSGYPRTQLDMIYFFPEISRVDGNQIGALTHRAIDGKNFQRWSRHRTGQNPWREGVDNISTHMALVEYWFEREFKVRPRAISI